MSVPVYHKNRKSYAEGNYKMCCGTLVCFYTYLVYRKSLPRPDVLEKN